MNNKTKRIAKRCVSIAIGALMGLKALMPIASATAAVSTAQLNAESEILVTYDDSIRVKTKMHESGEDAHVSFDGEFKIEPQKGVSLIDFGANLGLKSKSPNLSNRINIGVLLNDENESKASILVKAGYGNTYVFSKNGRQLFSNDAQIKGGALFTKNDITGKERPTQILLGFKDTIDAPVLTGRTSLDALLSAELIRALSEKEWSTDSYATEAVLNHTSNLSKKIIWHNKLSHNAISLNKERYFFVDKKIEQKATMALGYNGDRFKIIGLLTAESIKDDGSMIKTRAGLKIALSDWLLKSYIEKSITNNNARSNQYFASVRKNFKKFALELFYSHKKSKKPWLGENDNFIGFALGFGLGKSHDITKLMEDDLSNYEKDNFYNLTAYKDHKLAFNESTEQLNNIRKINEWISNITYKEGWGWVARSPLDVYSERGGDCDEQANWFSWTAKEHGYKAHVLDYYSGWSGHGVALLEDKKGNTFVAEYGEVYKINVNKNASLEEKAKAALNQCGNALALVPYENEEVEFFVFDPSKGDYLDAYPGKHHGYMLFKGGKPKTETGVRILINDRFFK